MSTERAPRILTPEHVPIRLFPAGLGSRFLALFVDFAVVVGLSLVVQLALNLLLLPLGLGFAAGTVAFFVIKWGYHVFFEVRRQGQTPGKRICRLRVVDGRGLPITFQQSFVRNIVRMLDFVPAFYGLGAMSCLLDPRNRRLGDIAADTLVIHEREPADYSRQIADPRRFNSLQVPAVLRRIRRRVTLEERELLLSLCLRAETLDPQRKFDLMEEVGRRYREKLDIEDPHLSGENLVRGLTSILYSERA